MKKTIFCISLFSALLTPCPEQAHAGTENRGSLLLMWWNVDQ